MDAAHEKIWTVTARIRPLSAHPQSSLYRNWPNLTQLQAEDLVKDIENGTVSNYTEEFYVEVSVENDKGYLTTKVLD